MNYTYQLRVINIEKLDQEIKTVLPVSGLSVSDSIIVHSDTPLSNEQLTILSNLINNHNPNPNMQEIIRVRIKESINFANEMLVNFATENVLLGITQAGKTKEVADYLTDLLRYGQSGSLYEVVNELDRLIALGDPQGLAPFITVVRLEALKQQTLDFLS